jgi:hypothetical protein
LSEFASFPRGRFGAAQEGGHRGRTSEVIALSSDRAYN